MMSRAAAPLALLVALGCGTSEPRPRTPGASDGTNAERAATGPTSEPGTDAPSAAGRSSRTPSAISAQGDVGGLDQSEVDRTFASADRDIDRCWSQGSDRNELMAGSIDFVLQVGGDGRIVSSWAARSTLGDHDAERCMLKAFAARTWPRPVGGKVGVVKTRLNFDLPKDARPPTTWQAAQADEVLRSSASAIAACKRSSGVAFIATVYVKKVVVPPPEDAGSDAGDAGPTEVGAAIAVGMAQPDGNSDAVADCLVRVLTQAKYPVPGDWPAKLTFSL